MIALPTRADRFAFLYSRARALKSQLLTKAEYDAMIKARDVQDALRMLATTPYAPYLPKAEDGVDLIRVEHGLMEAYASLYRSLMLSSAITRAAKNLFSHLYSRFDYAALKSLLRAIYSGVSEELPLYYITPTSLFTTEVCEAILKRRDPRAVLLYIASPSVRKALEESLIVCDKLGSSLPAEVALDKLFYTTVWRLRINLEDYDRRSVSRIVGTEVDVANMLIVLRCKAMELSASETQEMLIPIRYRISAELENALSSPSVMDAMRSLASGLYSVAITADVLKSCEKEASITPLEAALRAFTLRENLAAVADYPFQAGPIMAFLNLKQYEIWDIRAILVGKANDIPPQEIVELTTLYRIL